MLGTQAKGLRCDPEARTPALIGVNAAYSDLQL
jgi:hypothetical protein